MGVAEILIQIDREIARLQRARTLLNGNGTKIAIHSNGVVLHRARKKRGRLTPEGRTRIADAQKRRWEKQRKTQK